ncbi:MAG: membrane protein insertion efficiency factor YidD [Firmicutes bacterium]|jgi:putative membrane protein insertion efficiency factor|nr:membrane protein insertion efficiency factor YidD [Bacillota bacterium]
MVKTIVLALIRFYQVCISPLLPPRCRFYPTCSEYGRQAVEKYGVGRGLVMLAKRLVRCHPWGAGGYDPVK